MTEEYDLDIKPKLQKVLKKLAKKNRKLAIAIDKKVKEICANPHRFKNLRNEMSEKNRIHFVTIQPTQNQLIDIDFDITDKCD